MSSSSAAPGETVLQEELQAKASIRAAALARRDAMDPQARLEASRGFAERGPAVLGEVADRLVSGFWPIRSELDPRYLMRRLAEGGAALALPSIEAGKLVFRRPLAAFDRTLGRIGYGKGYYDGAIARFAAEGKSPRKLGLAFACQEAPHIPMLAHDQRLDGVLTERELIKGPPPASCA
jgi:5-formyltetrahydrofolate cyclo-ligase